MATRGSFVDSPASRRFTAVPVTNGTPFDTVDVPGMSDHLREHRADAYSGDCVFWGVPFRLDGVVVAAAGAGTGTKTDRRADTSPDTSAHLLFEPFSASTVAFLHALDDPSDTSLSGFTAILNRHDHLGDHVADYRIVYEDGSEEIIPLRRRREIASLRYEPCSDAVPHRKTVPVLSNGESPTAAYGWHETRAPKHRVDPWMNWLFAWENPHPQRTIVSIAVVPVAGTLLVSGVSAGSVAGNPFRWRERRSCVLRLPGGSDAVTPPDEHGLIPALQLDLGQVISIRPRLSYPNDRWPESEPFLVPEKAEDEYVVEYTSHEDAVFTLSGGSTISVAAVEGRPSADGPDDGGADTVTGRSTAGDPGDSAPRLRVIAPQHRRVTVSVVDADTRRPIAAKLHIHGAESNYIAPVHRHRIPNGRWFEDYGADHVHQNVHPAAYVDGRFQVRLPEEEIYIEASKGFEYRPVRVSTTAPSDGVLEIPLSRDLDWRSRGWVTADTHVHFLSPSTALYEGRAEGVNIVNLLASQWGEMMTNVGDFDGESTLSGADPGSSPDFFVRVGTENRQHVLGHISLLGYSGEMISPLCTGGPDESALGDPVEVLISEWARRCREQNGIVVMPHIPLFCLESSAALVEGLIDAVEMVSWGNIYGGLDPYSLAHWYSFLNCGYHVPAVGGTDKMSQNTAVGTVRTYARTDPERELSYESWKEAIRTGDTFVSYGPLIDVAVEGARPGGTVELPAGGGTVTVAWEAESTAVQMSSAELVVNGEVVEATSLTDQSARGEWKVEVKESSWIACLVRGSHPGRKPVVAAHSSAVFVTVASASIFSPADGLAILNHIEGAIGFIDTIGPRGDPSAYRRMRLQLEGSARKVHNALHQAGVYHDHGATTDHHQGQNHGHRE